jgi:hypothetical protein
MYILSFLLMERGLVREGEIFANFSNYETQLGVTHEISPLK